MILLENNCLCGAASGLAGADPRGAGGRSALLRESFPPIQ